MMITGEELSDDADNFAAVFVSAVNLENFKLFDELFLFGIGYDVRRHA